MEIAVPIVAICLAVTTTEVNDASQSTVAYQELRACTICNKEQCPKPEWMGEAEKLAAELNRMQGAKTGAGKNKRKRSARR